MATLLGRGHVDLDRLIEARVGPLLAFIQRHGEASFREEEGHLLGHMLKAADQVVSLGGGTPCTNDNMDRLLAAGTVVFIDAPLKDLQERLLKKGRDRPLLFGLADDALRARVAELQAERLPTYRRATITVDGGGDPAAIAQRILGALDQVQLR